MMRLPFEWMIRVFAAGESRWESDVREGRERIEREGKES